MTDRTKVLLSVSSEDLAVIDANASAAGMSRSAYLVAMGRRGNVGVFDAIHQLQVELKRFEADNAGWRSEVKRLQDHNDALSRKLDSVRSGIGTLIEMLKSSAKMTKGDEAKAYKAATAVVEMLAKRVS